MDPVHFESVVPTINPPMVASKIETPVYVILDPVTVPDQLVTSKGDAKPIELYEVQTFVTRDIPVMLRAFYASVDVVESVPPAQGPHIIVDVKISKLDTFMEKAAAAGSSGGTATVYQLHGMMDWAMAFRHSGEAEYFYSFSDHVVGDYAATTIHDTENMFRSVWETALGRFLERYAGDEVQQLARGGAA